jgi:hypothetical protein
LRNLFKFNGGISKTKGKSSTAKTKKFELKTHHPDQGKEPIKYFIKSRTQDD